MICPVPKIPIQEASAFPGNVRQDFPFFSRTEGVGNDLVYLDSAATSHKPDSVLKRQHKFYRQTNSNVHRSVNRLGDAATLAYEGARKKIGHFINAASETEIVFTSGATMGINLVANSWCRQFLKPGDEILLSEMEHHSNLIPWQLAAKMHGAALRFIPINPNGTLNLEKMHALWNPKIKLVAVTHVSNVLGTINPVKAIIEFAHYHNVPVLLDAAQSVPHMPVDVKDLDVDFMVFSGHKMCGPTGIGVLYGKRKWLEEMPPFLGGGDMINQAGLAESSWNRLPYKFEAGTPHIEGAVTLGAAVDYLSGLGMDKICNYDVQMAKYAISALKTIGGLLVYGPSSGRLGVIAFNLKGIHASDLAEYLDSKKIAIRSGHHCAEPLHGKLGISSSARVSLYIYNTASDIDILIENLFKAKKFFGT